MHVGLQTLQALLKTRQVEEGELEPRTCDESILSTSMCKVCRTEQ